MTGFSQKQHAALYFNFLYMFPTHQESSVLVLKNRLNFCYKTNQVWRFSSVKTFTQHFLSFQSQYFQNRVRYCCLLELISNPKLNKAQLTQILKPDNNRKKNKYELQGTMGLAWLGCLERNVSWLFQVGVCGFWGTMCVPVSERLRHTLRQ